MYLTLTRSQQDMVHFDLLLYGGLKSRRKRFAQKQQIAERNNRKNYVHIKLYYKESLYLQNFYFREYSELIARYTIHSPYTCMKRQ